MAATMTVQEAEAFVKEAEGLPVSRIDPEKLQMAIEVLARDQADDATFEKAQAMLSPWGPGIMFARQLGSFISQVVGGPSSILDRALKVADKFGPVDGSPGESPRDEVEAAKPGTEKPPTAREIAAAKRTVQEAERESPENVDVDGLLEAVSVFERAGPAENEYRSRAAALAAKVPDRESLLPEAEPVDPDAAPEPERSHADRGRGAGVSRRRAEAGPRIPSDLLNRLYSAAKGAGISPREVQAVIAEAQAAASAGLSPEILAEMEARGLPPPADGDLPSAADLLEVQILDWTSGALGVPDGFFAQRDEAIPAGEGLERFRQREGLGTPTRVREVAPRYFDGDQHNYAGLPPEQIAALQRRLEAAGQLGEGIEGGAFWTGVWDGNSSEAMKRVMEMANRSGLELDDQLDLLIANLPETVIEARNVARLERQFQAPVFMPIDPDAASQTAKQAVRQRVGRDPTPDELAEIAALLVGLDRQDFDQQVAAARAEFDAQMASLDTGQYVTPGAIPDVDPIASLNQYLDERLGPEMAFIEDRESFRHNLGNVNESFARMGLLIGGR